MSNEYYNTPAVPVDYTLARADQIKEQLAAIAGGFDKLPLPSDLHENRIGFAIAEGTANALTVALDVPPFTYEDGMTLKVAIITANTAEATINVNGLGVIPIVGRTANPLAAGDLVAGTVETMIYYAGKFIIREVSGSQGPTGLRGPPGPLDGSVIVSGTGEPATEVNNGDVYIRTGVWTIYGPKTAGDWGSATNIIGPDGTSGTDGYDGSNGINGLRLLNGAGNPTVGDGVDGEFWINTAAKTIFGPKAAGAWPAGTSFIGPKGDPGDDGTGGSWNDLGDRPAALLALAGLAGAAGKIPYFTDAEEAMGVGTIVEIVTALDATNRGLLASALGAIRIESMSLANPGYLRLLLPDGTHGIFQWGTEYFASNSNTTVNYPCPTPYESFSIAVVSSANIAGNAQDNPAGIVSCGLTSFVAYSAVNSAKPGFWLAWGI